jgi:dolichyl-phosphate beta-glucosyltransferase
MKNPYLSVVIPAYNEEINLRRGVLSSISEYLKEQEYSWEVLIIDDGSTDLTASMVFKFTKNNHGFHLHKEPHRGKGGTVIAGMLKAKGEIILFTDMDQATPIDQLKKFIPKFGGGYDVVIGSRSGREGAPIIRKTMAFGFMFLRNLILRLPYKDTQCGFKAFTKPAAKRIFKKMKIFSEKSKASGASVTAGFDLEVLYIARKLGLRVAEVQVEWHEYGERREVSPIKDSWEGFRDLVRVRVNASMGKYT